MKKLPPIFKKVRLRLPKHHIPPLVFYIDDEVERQMPSISGLRSQYGDDGDLPMTVFEHLWVELSNGAFLFKVMEIFDRPIPQRTFIDTRVQVSTFDQRGEFCDTFTFDTIDPLNTIKGNPVLDTAPNSELQRARHIILGEFYRISNFIAQLENLPAEISTNTRTRNRPAIFQRQGDTIRYARLEELKSSAGHQAQRDYVPPDEPSGIKKREHSVIGHWRTYRSGVKVWVKPHKRGDPELGKVTRVLS